MFTYTVPNFLELQNTGCPKTKFPTFFNPQSTVQPHAWRPPVPSHPVTPSSQQCLLQLIPWRPLLALLLLRAVSFPLHLCSSLWLPWQHLSLHLGGQVNSSGCWSLCRWKQNLFPSAPWLGSWMLPRCWLGQPQLGPDLTSKWARKRMD